MVHAWSTLPKELEVTFLLPFLQLQGTPYYKSSNKEKNKAQKMSKEAQKKMFGKKEEKARFQSCEAGAQSYENTSRKTVCCKLVFTESNLCR